VKSEYGPIYFIGLDIEVSRNVEAFKSKDYPFGGRVRKIILVSLMLSSVCNYLYANELSELEVGSTARIEQVKSSLTDLVASISKEVEQRCDEQGCTLISKVTNNKGWTVMFSVGTGAAAGNGTNIYLNGQQSNEQQNSVGVSIRYENKECLSSIKIGRTDLENLVARGRGQRNSDLSDMRPLTSDDKFIELIKLEYGKLLSQNGCGN